jgi:hypothetical protein
MNELRRRLLVAFAALVAGRSPLVPAAPSYEDDAVCPVCQTRNPTTKALDQSDDTLLLMCSSCHVVFGAVPCADDCGE